MTFRFLDRPKIRNDLRRFHHDLPQQQRSRAYDLADDTHHAHKFMYFRQITTICTELFPDIRDSVKTDNIDPLITKEQHVLRHVDEYSGIGIVQIPLIGIEGRHNDLSRLFAPAEVAWSRSREDLRDVLFVFFRDRPFIVKEITILVLPFPCTCTACPLVVLARMIHHKIQAYGYPALVAIICERGKVFHGAKFRLDLPKISDSISPVASPLRALKQRHQMQIIHAALLDIVQLAVNAVQISGKRIDIHLHAEHGLFFIPIRILQT